MTDAPRFPEFIPSNQVQVDTFRRTGAKDLNRTSKPEQKPTEAKVGGPGSLLPLVYGRARIESGKIFAVSTNSFDVTFGVAWCIGEVEEVVSVTINDIAPPTGVDVYNYTGTSSQTADARLVAAITDYDDDLPGICYSVVVIPWNAEIAGFPIFSAEIKGKKILVGEGGSPTYTENPAYILRDFLASSTYGLGVTVDWASTNISAAHCDDAVDLDPGPGTEKRHELNIVLNQSLPALDWVNNLRDYARLFVVPDSAGYKILPDIAGASVKTFDEDNIVAGSLRIAHPGFDGAPTMIEVVYTDKSQIPYAQESYTTDAATPRRLSRIMRPGILRYSEAVRYADDRLQDLTGRLDISWTTFDEALAIQAGDLVTIDHAVGLYSRSVRVIAIDPISPGLWKISAVPAPTGLSGRAPSDPPRLPALGPPVITWDDGTPWDIYGRVPGTPTATVSIKTYNYYTDATNTYDNTGMDVWPPCSWAMIVYYHGPTPATGESVVFNLIGAPSGVTTDGPFDYTSVGYNNADNLSTTTDDYDSSLIGKTFGVYGRTTDGAYTTPLLIITISATHDPITQEGTWFRGYFDPTGPTFTAGDEYPQYFVAGEYHDITLLYGYDWEGPTANITWVVTQLTGTTRNIDITHSHRWHWYVTRDESTSYAGTSYQFQAQLDGVDWMDPFTLTCES